MSRSVCVVAALLLAAPALAVPGTFTHQGRLIDSSGTPIDGPQDLAFSIYDAETDGTAAWTETLSGVNVDNGFYSVVLGEQTPADSAVFADAEALWLGLAVGTDAELPRSPLSSVPFALVADWAATADHATSADSVSSSAALDVASVSINGAPVIGSDGTIDYTSLINVPDGSDTLDELGCIDAGDLAQFDGGVWTCVNSDQLSIAAGNILGTLDVSQLPMGDTSGTVAHGDHTHGFDDLTGDLVLGDVSSCTEGAVRYKDGRFEGCDGEFWLALSAEKRGSSASSAVATCGDVQGSDDGLYWLDGDGAGGLAPVQTLCDQTTDGGGWALAYKYASGSAGDPPSLFTTGAAVTDTSVINRDGGGHYTSPFTTTWFSGFTEARVEVLVGGTAVHYLVFDLNGATSTDWFAQARLTDTSWTDLSSSTGLNFFGISGDAGNNRHLFINQGYGGCPNDVGWLVVSDTNGPCTWDQANAVRYADADTKQNWVSGSVGDADALAIFFR